MKKRVLVVVAHADDEALGCGGTIRRHHDAGHEVLSIRLTDGVGARGVNPAAARRRSASAEESAALLGFRWIASGDFVDNGLDQVPLLDLVRFIEDAVRDVSPAVIYGHYGADLNVDHRRAFEATLTAFRPLPGHGPIEFRCFEVPSSTEWSHGTLGPPFSPNVYVDISSTWESKRRALCAYAEEMRDFPHSRSFEALDAMGTLRGSQVGLRRAEGFALVRQTIPEGWAP